MEPTNSSKTNPNSADDDYKPGCSNNKKRRQQAKRQKRMEDSKREILSKPFSNYRLPVSVPSTDLKMVHLSRYESISDRERHPPLYVIPDQKSQWARLRMIACPCHGCSCTLDPSGWLAHYLSDHMPKLGITFVDVPFPVENQTLRATCNVACLDYDVNTLLGVFGYQRCGLNPLKCPRNTLLPKKYRMFSQHGVLLLFACRTRHGLLWQRNRLDDVVAIWVATPMQDVSIPLRCVVQAAQSSRYYSKRLQARILPTSGIKAPPCREFIKTDYNVIVISFQDLRQLMSLSEGQQQLNVELRVMGEGRNI